MNDVEYIIKIILRARDEVATAFAKAREQIRGFGDDSKRVTDDVNKMNSSVTSLNRRLGTLLNRTNEVRGALKALSKTEGEAADEARELEQAEGRVVIAQRAHAEQTRKLTRAHEEFVKVQRDLAAANKNERSAIEQRLVSISKQLDAERDLRAQTAARVRDTRDQAQELRGLSDSNRDYESSLGGAMQMLERFSSVHQEFKQSVDRAATSQDRQSDSTRRNTRSLRDSEGAQRGVIATLNRLSDASITTGENIATFDNKLRGLLVLGVLVFAQQLITLLIGLGGQLVAVASSAIMAGSALAGGFTAGALQAIPVIGLLIAAFARVKAVFDAVQQADLAKKQAFGKGAQQDRQAADRADQITNANDSLTSALEAVSDAKRRANEAQLNLNKARVAGKRELEDLIDAEKRANLAMLDSRRAVEVAIQSGASLSDLRGAELDATRATRQAGRQRVDTRRAVAGGVEGLDSVKQARQGVEDAARAVDKAERSVDRARRGLERARRSAAATGTELTGAAASLGFFLSQLSDSERKLYDRIQNLREVFKKNIRPITDILIDSFSDGISRVTELLNDSRILNLGKGLAEQMSDSFGAIQDAFLGDEMIDQLVRIGDAGRKNLSPLTDIAISLGNIIADVAEAAGPALSKFLDWISGIVDKWEEFIDKSAKDGSLTEFFLDGEEHLESWLELIGAIIGLFAALVGGSAKEGKDSIEDLTDTIEDATEWIRTHQDEVAEFFRQARKVTDIFLGVVRKLAEEMASAFDSEPVDAFGDVAKNVLIPALGDAVILTGTFITLVARLIDQPVIGTLIQWAITLTLFSKAVTGLVGVVGIFAKGLARLATIVAAPFKLLGRLGPILRSPLTALALLTSRLGLSGAAAGRLFTTLSLLRGGPVGAIAALVAGAVLLAERWGILGDAWDAIKDAANDAIKPIKDAFKDLADGAKEFFDALGIGGGYIGKVGDDLLGLLDKFKPVQKLFSQFALIGPIRVFGKTLAGVFEFALTPVRALAGLLRVVARLIKGDFGGALDALKDVGKEILERVIAPFKGLGKGLVQYFKDGVKAFKDFLGISSPSKLFTGFGRDIVAGLFRGFTGLASRLFRLWRSGWARVIEFLSGLSGRFGRFARNMVSRVTGAFSGIGGRLLTLWRRGFTRIWDYLEKLPGRFKTFAEKAVEGFGKGFSGIGKIIGKAITGAGKAGLDIAKAFAELIDDILPNKIPVPHGPDIPLPDNPLGDLGLYQEGGPIGRGYGGGDRIPILAEEGEHMWTKEEVSSAGGHAAMYAMRAFFGRGGQASGQKMQEGGKPQPRAGGNADVAIALAQKDLDNILTVVRRVGGRIAGSWRNIWSSMNRTTRRNLDSMGDRTNSEMRRMLRIVNRQSDKMVDTMRTNMTRMKRVVYGGFDYIADTANESLKAFGGDAIKIKLKRPGGEDRARGGIVGMASGGMVGNMGERGKDLVNTWLGRGEMVLNWAHQKYVQPAVQWFYGHGLGETFNRVRGLHAGTGDASPGMAAGGYTGPGHSGAGFTPVWNLARSRFKQTGFTGFDGHNMMTQSGNVSDHYRRQALDISDGQLINRNKDALSGFFKTKLPQVVKQLIWRDVDQFSGYPIGGHQDHVHLAMHAPYAFNSSRMAKLISRASRGLSISDLLVAGAAGPDQGVDVDHVDKLKVEGKGPFRKALEKIVNKIRNAANKYLDEEAGTVQGGTAVPAMHYDGPLNKDFGSNSPVTLAHNQVASLAERAGLPGITFAQIAKGESGYRPGAVSPDGGFGLWQITPRVHGPDLQKMWSRIGSFFNPWLNAKMAKVLYDRAGGAVTPWFGTRYMTGTNLHYQKAARGGIMGSYDVGGEIPGSEGQPVPILAHAQEWVVNKVQQSKLAQLVGTTRDRLKGMLGFSGGPTSFQGGGEVMGVADYRRFQRQQSRRAFNFPAWEEALSRMTWRALDRLIKDADRQIKRIKRDGVTSDEKKGLKAIQKLRKEAEEAFLDLPANLPLDMSLLINLGKRLHVGLKRMSRRGKDFFKDFANAVDEATREGGLIERMDQTREFLAARRARGLTFRQFSSTRGGYVTQNLDTVQVADEQLDIARSSLKDIVGQEGFVTKTLRSVRRQLRRAVKKGDTEAVKELSALENRLNEQYASIRDAHAAALDAVFQAQVARQQAIIDEITTRYTRQTTWADLFSRVATALGRTDWLAALNQGRIQILTNQANELAARIAHLRNIGAKTEADALEDQVGDLRVQIFELIQQNVRDAMEVINNAATRRLGRLDLFGRMADALGRVGLGGAVTVGGESLSRAGVFTARQQTLESQRSQLQALLRSVQANPLTAGNVALIQELTDSLAELDVTIAENTKAFFTARVEEVNAIAEFGLSFEDAGKRISELKQQLGIITPEQSVAEQIEIQNKRADILAAQGVNLQKLLDEAILRNDTQAIQDLQLQLRNNEIAQLENTLALNEINGQLTQPQGFSSSAWQWFREAIFTGMGQVLPQYSIPSAATGAIVTRSGLVNVHAPEVIASPTQLEALAKTSGGGDKFEIYTNGVDGEIDYEHLGETIAFKKNNSGARGG